MFNEFGSNPKKMIKLLLKSNEDLTTYMGTRKISSKMSNKPTNLAET